MRPAGVENHPPHKKRRKTSSNKVPVPKESTQPKTLEGFEGFTLSSDHFLCRDRVPALFDLCAKVTAENVAFQRVEERCSPIPEPVQKRILFWSFPRDEMHIRMYSSPCCGPGMSSSLTLSPVSSPKPCGSNGGDDSTNNSQSASSSSSGTHGTSSATQTQHSSFQPPSPFTEGLRLYDNNCVEDALQIGFHLSGVVRSLAVIEGERKAFTVSVSFDRCKITSVKCSCDSRDIHWCQHVVALSLHRIRLPLAPRLRLPISETLYQMDRVQLQKFVQYLIAEHHTEVLPTAQTLADEILKPQSTINNCAGAPDPTAGPCAETDHSWFLDENQVCSMVRTCLSAQSSSMEPIHSLFAKVREMLRQRDENGPRLLMLLTEQFLAHPWFGGTFRYPHPHQVVSEKWQQMWDQIGALWVCIVLNPFSSGESRGAWEGSLRKWMSSPACPQENGSYIPHPHGLLTGPISGSGSSGSSQSGRPRTVLHRAVDACRIQWKDTHLEWILGRSLDSPSLPSSSSSEPQQAPISGSWSYDLINSTDNPMWHEHVPTACARVESLRAHGYGKEALRLAVSVVRAIKYGQERKAEESAPFTPGEGWIGHPLDPLNSLFDTLASASQLRKTDHQVPGSPRPPFVHVPPGGKRCAGSEAESYLTLATEVAIISLGQQRRMPSCSYANQKALRQEENLIQKLKMLTFDPCLLDVIQEQALALLKGGWWSGLGDAVAPDTMPVHNLACYLFQTLLPHNRDLAYKIGIRALRIPIRVEEESEDSNMLLGHSSTWTIPFSHIENQHSHLANSMLLASKDDVPSLRSVLEAIHRYMRSSSLVYRLAHEIHREATSQPEHSASRQNLLNTALELGLQVLRLTVGSPSWSRREMVKWLVGCASNLTLEAVQSILLNWHQLFTALEASDIVAKMLAADQVVLQLKLDKKQQEALQQSIFRVALQCARTNPPCCAKHALSLCEKDPDAFDQAYRLVFEAARTNCMPAIELFSIAKSMYQRNHLGKAYDMAILGLANTHIGYSDETSSLIPEIYWVCTLGHEMDQKAGQFPGCPFVPYRLSEVISLIVKNVKCATVLSEILRGYALGSNGLTALCSAQTPASATISGSTDLSSVTNGAGGVPKRKGSNGSTVHCHLPPHSKHLPFDKPPLSQLLEAAVSSYVNTTHSRLQHISPRHYNEFLDFLCKARDTFSLAADGTLHFSQLLENMKLHYKGKKKLMALITERFG